MKAISLDQFYQDITTAVDSELNALLPRDIQQEIGHFNVEDLFKRLREKHVMPYDRRAYYKISLISGRNRAEYADKVRLSSSAANRRLTFPKI